jgi:hypothetical protein
MMQAAAGNSTPIEAVAYVGLQNLDKIVAVNVTDPSNMSIISEVSLNGPSDFALDEDRNILFVVSAATKRVYAYDISDPTQMTLLNNQVVTTSFDAVALGYDPVNERLFISTRSIVDVSTPGSMVVTLTNNSEYRSSRYVRQHSTSGSGLFALPFSGSTIVRSIEVRASIVNIEDDFSESNYGIPDAIAADETNNLLFSCATNLRIHSMSNIGDFSLESSAAFNDTVFSVAVNPSALRAYAFFEESNGTRRLSTLSYSADGTGLTSIQQSGSFGIQTQIAHGLHVNGDRGVLGMTTNFTSGASEGASDLRIYGLANPSAPSLQGTFSLAAAASGENFSFVKIQNYPIA